MRKAWAILFLIVNLLLPQSLLLQGELLAGADDKNTRDASDSKNSKKSKNSKTNPTYKFDYIFQGKTSGTILLLFRYRFFLYASASAIFRVEKITRETTRFTFVDIDKPGILTRTFGFSGKGLITGAVAYNSEETRELLANDMVIIREKAADFSRLIKRREVYPYKLLSGEPGGITFLRTEKGIHREGSLNLTVQPISDKNSDHFNFKLYEILMEMLKIYNHPFFPENVKTWTDQGPDNEWYSPPLDFSDSMNNIGCLATAAIKKLITFKQIETFKLTYRVISRTPGKLTIEGKAEPCTKIWNSYEILQVCRTTELRLPDGLLLQDKFFIDIKNPKGKGGQVHCSLTLIR